jgi:cell volume regulation protein A
MFADTFEEGVREGDRLDIGNITLIARSVRDGVVTAIALIVGDTAEDAPLAQSRIVAPALARVRAAAQRTANRIAEVVHRRGSGRVQ